MLTMEKLTDPTVCLKLSDNFVRYLKKNGKELLKQERVPTNLRKVIEQIANKEAEVSMLRSDDLDWFQQYLRELNNPSDGDGFVEGCDSITRELSESGDMDSVYDAILRDKDKLLKDCSGVVSVDRNQLVWLHELMDGCEMVLPENRLTTRNPELERRIQKLKKEQEDREYKEMTRNVNTVKKPMPEDSIAFQLRMMNRHLIGVGQFILSVAAGFAFGFVGIQYMVGELDFGFRILLGIMFGLIIALAEIYFLAKHLAQEYEDDVPLFGARKKNLSEKPGGKLHQD